MNKTTKSVALTYAKNSELEECGASGIFITDDWIITHGSLLNARIKKNHRLRLHFDQLEPDQLTKLPIEDEDDLKLRIFQQQYQSNQHSTMEKSANNDDSIISMEHQKRKLLESEGSIVAAWKCPLLQNTFADLLFNLSFNKTRDVNRNLLPIFLMISLKKSVATDDDEVSRASEALTQFFHSCIPALEIPKRADSLEILSTPCGNPVFIDSLSRGVVSNIFGDGGCVILTDANAVSGSEGAPIYVTRRNGTRRSICGMVIAPLSWCRGEWVDYTFAASLLPCLRRLLFGSSINDLQQRENTSSSISNINESLVNNSERRIADLLDSSLVLVSCGAGWGTGIILDVRTGIILTCAHVVQQAPETRIKVVLRRPDDDSLSSSGTSARRLSTRAKLVYRTSIGKPYDVAVLRIDPREIHSTLRSITIDTVRPIVQGEDIGSAGFPFFSSRLPTITRGNVSATSKCMLQTTCRIQSGSSGGPIVRWSTGEMLGMVVCNSMSTRGKLYPRLNMAIPASILKAPLDEFLRTGEAKVLAAFDTNDADVQKTWNFQHLPSSKM